MEGSMKVTSALFMAVSAVLFFSGAARAADNVLLAVNKPVKTELSIKTELASAATVQINAGAAVSDDFDALSAVNDPLYREGSKEFLQQVSKLDAAGPDKAEKPAKKEPVKEALRDAPNSPAPDAIAEPAKVKPVIKRSRLIKVIPADPVKSKNTF
jgi:hypothetical protein